jgi:hypothetical protein
MAAHSHMNKDRQAQRICLTDLDKGLNSAVPRRAFLVAFLYEATTRLRPAGATRGTVFE